jgi:hypothetical protein
LLLGSKKATARDSRLLLLGAPHAPCLIASAYSCVCFGASLLVASLLPPAPSTSKTNKNAENKTKNKQKQKLAEAEAGPDLGALAASMRDEAEVNNREIGTP